MAAGAWQITDTGRKKMIDGTFDIDSDVFKVALFLAASDLSLASEAFSSVTSEHAAANGYIAGGEAVTLTIASGQSTKVDFSVDPVWTAASGPITARYACLYEVGGDVLCFCELDDTPADVTATDGNTLTVQAAAAGVIVLA